MKISYYISIIIISISLSSNCYVMESKEYNVYNRDTLVKFNDSNNRCGLASLNQCFSILNSGNNQFLKQFTHEYYKISQDPNRKTQVLDPKYIIEPILSKTQFNNNLDEVDAINKTFFTDDCNKFLTGNAGYDVAERYHRLFNMLSITQYSMSNINAFSELQNCEITNNSIDYITLVKDGFSIGNYVTNNTLNLIINNNDITDTEFYKQIQSNTTLNFNNNIFELSALILLVVDQNGQPKKTSVSHFVSSKKLSNNKWRFIDSSHNNQEVIYNTFSDLMKTYVIPPNPNAKLKRRLMPKLMFYTKILHNNKQQVQNNVNKTCNINNKKSVSTNNIKSNSNIIRQINITNNKSNNTINKNQNNITKINVVSNNINKRNNNKQSIRNNNNLQISNKQKEDLQKEINSITNQIDENKEIIMQMADKYNVERVAMDNFIQNICNDNKSIFDAILTCDFKNKKDDIYEYFANYDYGWLYENALEIISNILNLQQKLVFQLDV